MADNHSLMFSFAGLISMNPLIHDKLPYDPARDVVPVAAALDSTLAVVVSETLNLGTLQEFVARARAEPGKRGHHRPATLRDRGAAEEHGHRHHPDHLIATSRRRSRIFCHRPGAPDRHRHHAAVAAGVGGPRPLPDDPQPRPLAARARRADAREAGFPDLSFDATNGFYGWRDMPEAVKNKIAADVRVVASDPAVAERLKSTGAVMRPGTPADFAAAIEEQCAKVAAVAEALKAKPK